MVGIKVYIDIEIIIQLENILNDNIISDISDTMLKCLDIDYNQVINKHIEREQEISDKISLELEREFDIRDRIESEVIILTEHLPYIKQPQFIDIIFD